MRTPNYLRKKNDPPKERTGNRKAVQIDQRDVVLPDVFGSELTVSIVAPSIFNLICLIT